MELLLVTVPCWGINMRRLLLFVLFTVILCSRVQADPYSLPSGTKAWGGAGGWKSDINKVFNYFSATAGEPEEDPTIIGPLNVVGTGDSWLELENNTSFTDVLIGKYGLRFYNGELQKIINGTASAITSGGVTITEGTDTADPSTMSEGDIYVETDTGNTTIKTALGFVEIAGTYTADPIYYTLTVTDPGNGDVISSTDTFIDCGDGATDCTHDYESGSTPELTATAAAGREFTEWTGDATDTSTTTNPDTITMDSAKDVGATFGEAGCAGGSDGYVGRSDFGGYTTGCAGTCTTNYLYYSKFVVETDPSQEDGTVTYAHWNTQFLNASTRAGIWNSSGNLVVGTAEQEGNDSDPNTYNASVSETCLAAGTYYVGIWVEGDAWANAATSGYDAGQWTRIVEMSVFGNIGSDPETAGSVHAANAEVAAWFNNTSGR